MFEKTFYFLKIQHNYRLSFVNTTTDNILLLSIGYYIIIKKEN